MKLALLGISDLAGPGGRWLLTKQGLHAMLRSPFAQFPEPAAVANRGRVLLWTEAQIGTYESTRPWLLDPAAKRRRLYAIRRALLEQQSSRDAAQRAKADHRLTQLDEREARVRAAIQRVRAELATALRERS